ncbi:HNH endonuclease [Pedococcus sp.]|uniref:HNH endonuclease n=1 Tax=Pedococcus sp. TaxID=2860345 RepID=UPI002E140EE1|nr:DUF222 domain-containing protein [Pedococcus sp.]
MFESGGRPQLTVTDVSSLVGGLAALDVGDLTDARRVDLMSVLESLKGAAAAVQARLAVDFAESQEAGAQEAGTRRLERRSVAAQVALARRESPHRGSRHLGFARAMVREMPHTMGHLAAGRVSEWRATILCRETACLSVVDRTAVDAALAADLPTLGDRQVQSRARALAARLDATATAKRAARAQGDRCVSLRPAPDTMTYLTALLPVAQGVAVFAALERAATTERAGDDDRGRGQLMADTLVERVTGQAAAAAVPIEVVMVMSGDTLAGLDDSPAEVPGYGPVPGEAARAALAASSDTEASIWFRRALTSPDGARLIGLDSRRRLFPVGLKRFLVLRDRTCRTPWCDAPIRHADHVLPARRGGSTTSANGQGLCEACNQVKEAAGWSARVVQDGTREGARHRVRLRTPYDSTAPPLLEGAPAPDISWVERRLHLRLGAA